MAAWLKSFSSILIFPVGAYLEGVWSAFNIRTSGTLCSLTKAAILCRNWNRISSHAALGIAGLDVVLVRLVILRRLYTEFTNDLTSKSKYCPYVSKSDLISPVW